MRLELTGRHLTITAAARKFAEQRIAHMLRVLNDSAVSAHVVLTKERTRVKAEVTLHVKHERFLHGEGMGPDAQTAISVAADKVERQAEKLKGKWSARKRRSLPALQPAPVASPNGGPARRIIRARRHAVKPMSIEDAAAEISDGTDAVIVFRNSATDVVTVLFRRTDGHLGLIEPEV
jgi:putative sigma-54 modulation protein